jgi:hypothetical protein
VREIPWQSGGVWLKADTHVHTQFSDGRYTVDQVVARAREFGCDVIAITDHLDDNLDAATPEYFAAIDAARRAHPDMIILAGGEWNIPPWGGDEHATILTVPAAEHALSEFKRRFDDLHRPTHDPALAREALAWLAANATADGVRPVVIYEHPSRNDDRSAANAADMNAWRSVNDLVVSFAGAPGHQVLEPVGGYEKEQTIDRWDPAVARPGDAWDTLLAQGLDVWGAYVTSDFHRDVGDGFSDYWPCQFGGTWVRAPQRDAAGFLQGLRAGSFFAEHGGIARQVELQISAEGLPRPAGAGEAIAAAAGTALTIEVRFQTGAQQGTTAIDRVQLVAIDEAGTRVEFDGRPMIGRSVSHTMAVPPGGLVIRARGYRERAENDRLAFYTNPVRVNAYR